MRLIPALLPLLLIAPIWAAAPTSLNDQGELTDRDSSPQVGSTPITTKPLNPSRDADPAGVTAALAADAPRPGTGTLDRFEAKPLPSQFPVNASKTSGGIEVFVGDVFLGALVSTNLAGRIRPDFEFVAITERGFLVEGASISAPEGFDFKPGQNEVYWESGHCTGTAWLLSNSVGTVALKHGLVFGAYSNDRVVALYLAPNTPLTERFAVRSRSSSNRCVHLKDGMHSGGGGRRGAYPMLVNDPAITGVPSSLNGAVTLRR